MVEPVPVPSFTPDEVITTVLIGAAVIGTAYVVGPSLPTNRDCPSLSGDLPIPPGLPHRGLVPGLPTFFDASHGVLPVTFTKGNHNTVVFFVTSDSGSTWAASTPAEGPSTAHFEGVPVPTSIADPAHWMAAVGGFVFFTSDAGATWSRAIVRTPQFFPNAVQQVSPTVAWAETSNSACAGFKTDCYTYWGLYTTTDGGRHWTAVLRS